MLTTSVTVEISISNLPGVNISIQWLGYAVCLSQLLERVFPNAEALKKKLKEKYVAEEKKRQAELVSSHHYYWIECLD